MNKPPIYQYLRGGCRNDFHRLFEVEDRDVHEHRGLSALGGFCGPRLWDLYRKILKYI